MSLPAEIRGPAWNGWGAELANTRYQPRTAASLAAADVPKLTLKWAFGFEGALAARTQPTIVAGRAVHRERARRRLRARRKDRLHALDVSRAGSGSYGDDRGALSCERCARRDTRCTLAMGGPMPTRSMPKPASLLWVRKARRASQRRHHRSARGVTRAASTCRHPQPEKRCAADGSTTGVARFVAACLRSMPRPGAVMWKSYSIPDRAEAACGEQGRRAVVWSRRRWHLGRTDDRCAPGRALRRNGQWLRRARAADDERRACLRTRDRAHPLGEADGARTTSGSGSVLPESPDQPELSRKAGAGLRLRHVAAHRANVAGARACWWCRRSRACCTPSTRTRTAASSGSIASAREARSVLSGVPRPTSATSTSATVDRCRQRQAGCTRSISTPANECGPRRRRPKLCAGGADERCFAAQGGAVTVIPGVVFSGGSDGGLRAYSTRDGSIVVAGRYQSRVPDRQRREGQRRDDRRRRSRRRGWHGCSSILATAASSVARETFCWRSRCE